MSSSIKMYHLTPKEPEKFGDVLIFANLGERLEETTDWQYCRDEYQLVGTYELTPQGEVSEHLPESVGV